MRPVKAAINHSEVRFLSAMLSQALVAFTLEADNEFERRMRAGGYIKGRLSLTVWFSLIRHVGPDGSIVRDIAQRAHVTESQIRFQLGCLERWGVIHLDLSQGVARRNGFGSGRGIRATTLVRLTSLGAAACQTWTGLPEEVEERWVRRFGAGPIQSIRQSLIEIVSSSIIELPDFLASVLENTDGPNASTVNEEGSSSLALPVLISRALMLFRIEFERQSIAPLDISANAVRVLGQEPIPEVELAHLTGCAPEVVGLGWRLKQYVEAMAAPSGRRGKHLSLSSKGFAAKEEYPRLNAEIEANWSERFGFDCVHNLRLVLEEIFTIQDDQGLLIAQGLLPPERTVRGGEAAPSLGRKELTDVARLRARRMADQTVAFSQDPVGALPHFPIWDMNRGFGP